MSTTSPTADWALCGDTFYRKTKVYDAIFDQDLELENHIVAGAPYGGAIGNIRRSKHVCQSLTIPALFRDEDKLRTYRGTGATKPSIDIYSLAGKSIRSINVDRTFLVLSVSIEHSD